MLDSALKADESTNISDNSDNIFNSEPAKEEKTETLDLMAEDSKNEQDVKKKKHNLVQDLIYLILVIILQSIHL